MINKERMTLGAMLLVTILVGTAVGVMPAEGERKGNMISLDLNLVMERSDAILTARLVPVPLPYEVLGKEFYQIMPDDVIDGSLDTNSLLVVITNVLSSEGKAAEIERDVLYMLFLRKVDLSADGLPSGLAAYYLVGNWKGVVPLDAIAVERRAVRRLEYQYGINVDDVPQEFVEAVKASFDAPISDTTQNSRNETKLSNGAMRVYNALKLKKHKKVSEGTESESSR